MLTTRRTRFTTALIALLSLLFMQVALARYVCPGTGANIAGAAALAQAVMPCADPMAQGMDDAQPNLCKAHCEVGQQSSSTYHVPALDHASAVRFFYPPSTTAPVPLGVTLQTPLLRRSTAPPLAVRNCCFRI